MKYLKVWTNFEDVISPLTDGEAGRLFRIMLKYAADGSEPESFEGNEVYIWPTAKRDIDMSAEFRETKRNNGLKGGRPKTKENQTEPTETKENQTEPIETENNLKRKEKKGNEKKRKETEVSFMDDDEAAVFQREHDRVFLAAEDSGFKMSNSVRAALIQLYSEYGLDKMLAAFIECVNHGAPNLAYLGAVLKGGQKKPVRALPAQNYTQRDYSGAADDVMAEHERQMAEWLKGGAAG